MLVLNANTHLKPKQLHHCPNLSIISEEWRCNSEKVIGIKKGQQIFRPVALPLYDKGENYELIDV